MESQLTRLAKLPQTDRTSAFVVDLQKFPQIYFDHHEKFACRFSYCARACGPPNFLWGTMGHAPLGWGRG